MGLLMTARRASTVFCSFDGCDEVACGTVGASAFCMLHQSTVLALLDSGTGPEVILEPAEPVGADNIHQLRGRRGPEAVSAHRFVSSGSAERCAGSPNGRR
jgi:hypothetical protein